MLDAFCKLILLGIAGYYGYWLRTKWPQWRIYYAPLYILGSCLFLSSFIDSLVFQRAIVASYYHTEGWISEVRYQVPMYEWESIPLWLVCVGPLVGLAAMLWRLPRQLRAEQAVHYLLLLLLVYPWLAYAYFDAIEGNKPRYYEGAQSPPPIGSYLRIR